MKNLCLVLVGGEFFGKLHTFDFNPPKLEIFGVELKQEAIIEIEKLSVVSGRSFNSLVFAIENLISKREDSILKLKENLFRFELYEKPKSDFIDYQKLSFQKQQNKFRQKYLNAKCNRFHKSNNYRKK